ncbi:MAG: SIS domain-containing protein [Candidatus Dadabacteria bacterium]|nr:SIS domain-containing protein [Candidatus Dadabacteria bacterium]NIQ13736.1 SIS domain-containing protein [Candidatus Dadabacteria bacterium]
MKEIIISILRESAELKLNFAKESSDSIEQAANIIHSCLNSGGKVLIFGNGGSAADAQHIASELVGRFIADRRALPAVALTTDTSVITSISNDSSFDRIFSRQIEALGNKNDVAFGITTSGRSKNVINGMETAQKLGLKTVSMTGTYSKKLEESSDCIIKVPSKSTPRIQEVHITVGHILCEIIDSLFSLKNS